MKKILFICESGVDRSPTLRDYFNKKNIAYHCQSKGIIGYYERDQLSERDIITSDMVFVMTMKEYLWIKRNYGEPYLDKIHILGIDNSYSNGEDTLIECCDEVWARFEGGEYDTKNKFLPKGSKKKCCDKPFHSRMGGKCVLYQCQVCQTVIMTNSPVK